MYATLLVDGPAKVAFRIAAYAELADILPGWLSLLSWSQARRHSGGESLKGCGKCLLDGCSVLSHDFKDLAHMLLTIIHQSTA